MKSYSLTKVYRTGQPPQEIPLEDVSEYINDQTNFIWIDLKAPNSQVLNSLGEELSLHKLSLEDAMTTHQRPKLDEYGDHLFISSKTIQLDENRIASGDIHLFVGTNFIVIIRHDSDLDFTRSQERLSRPYNGFTPSRGTALYFILDEIIDQYQPAISLLHERFKRLEELLLNGGLEKRDLEKLYAVKRELTSLRDRIDPMQGIVLDLIRVHQSVTKDLKVYYRDIYDHTLRAVGTLDLLRASASDAMQYHMATLTLRQNEAVQKLAGWGAILAVPTVIFSLYGMNFKNMPELEWKWSYPAVLMGTILIGFFLYRRLKKRGWI